MHGDVILVGKFVQMVVVSYRLQHPVWTTNPKSTVYKDVYDISMMYKNVS